MFRRSPGKIVATVPAPFGGPNWAVEFWKPTLARPIVHGYFAPSLMGSLFHWFRIFRNREYSILVIRHNGRLVHRSCLIPKFFRWPFMSDGDVQVGSTWTDPDYQCRGLATFGLQQLVALCGANGRTVWYTAEDSNAAAIAVCMKCAFRQVATAIRVNRLGVRLLGRFCLLDEDE
ncbi:MAG: GNAT family N-acetyltransferase [Bryobacteraceae bacterium]